MPEASQIEYNLRELAEMMVRDRGLTEGHWMVLVRFKWAAANVETGPDDMSPSAIVGIQSVGIQRATAPTPLSVDASLLTGARVPAAPARTRRKKK